jgi:hypothetical protein
VADRDRYRELRQSEIGTPPAGDFGEAKPLRLRRIDREAALSSSRRPTTPRARVTAPVPTRPGSGRPRRGSDRLAGLIAVLLSFLLVGSLAALALIGSGGLPATGPAAPRSPLAQEVDGSPVEAPSPPPDEQAPATGEEPPAPSTIPAVIGRGGGVDGDLDEPDGDGSGGGGGGGAGQTGGQGGQGQEEPGDATGGEFGEAGEGAATQPPGVVGEDAGGNDAASEGKEKPDKPAPQGNAAGHDKDKGKGKPASPPDASGAGHSKGKGAGHVPGKGKGHESDAPVDAASLPPGLAKGGGPGKN